LKPSKNLSNRLKDEEEELEDKESIKAENYLVDNQANILIM
jgi:hypothetical protein